MNRQSTSISILTCLLLVLVVSDVQGQTNYSIFESRDFGEHSVGFRSHWKMDANRSYSTHFDQGNTYGRKKSPRPILVNVWYPAVKNPKTEKVLYGQFIDQISEPENSGLHDLSTSLVEYANSIVLQETLGKNEQQLNDKDREELNQYRQTPSHSHSNAVAKDGNFPIVVYHSGAGSSFDDNVHFCQWLASHGYIVIGSAYPKGNGNSFGIDAGDDSAKDIAFLIDYAVNHANGDWQRVAVVGHSAGAQAALHYVSSPTHLADTIVLLDTTIDYYGYPIAKRTWRSLADRLQRNKERIDIPMLIAAGSGASYQLMDQLAFSERTMLTVPFLDHNDFIAQGVIKNFFDSRLIDKDSDNLANKERHLSKIKSTYRSLNQYVLSFLNKRLKGSHEALDELDRVYLTNHQDLKKLQVEKAKKGTSGPSLYDMNSKIPPTPRQFLQLVAKNSANETIKLFERLRLEGADLEFTKNNMLIGSALFEAVQKGDANKAKELHAYLSRSNTKTLSAILFQGNWAVMRKRFADAKTFYKAVLVFEPNNKEYREKLDSVSQLERK